MQFNEVVRNRLKQVQMDDEKDVHYYLVQYGILRLNEDDYDRDLLEQLTKEDSGNMWISN
jgi:hypothetical protein